MQRLCSAVAGFAAVIGIYYSNPAQAEIIDRDNHDLVTQVVCHDFSETLSLSACQRFFDAYLKQRQALAKGLHDDTALTEFNIGANTLISLVDEFDDGLTSKISFGNVNKRIKGQVQREIDYIRTNADDFAHEAFISEHARNLGIGDAYDMYRYMVSGIEGEGASVNAASLTPRG